MPTSEHVAVTGGPGPRAAFDDCLAAQESLCRALEELADSLPERLDTRQALDLAEELRSVLARAHRVEEDWVLPRLSASSAGTLAHWPAVMARLRAEHAENEDYADELTEALAGFWARPVARAEAERLGYLLRGLFMGLRRHVAHDRDWLCLILGRLDDA